MEEKVLKVKPAQSYLKRKAALFKDYSDVELTELYDQVVKGGYHTMRVDNHKVRFPDEVLHYVLRERFKLKCLKSLINNSVYGVLYEAVDTYQDKDGESC